LQSDSDPNAVRLSDPPPISRCKSPDAWSGRLLCWGESLIFHRNTQFATQTHVAPGLGLNACQKGLAVGFTTAAVPVHELHEARDENVWLRLQHQLAGYKLLIVDELGIRSALTDRRRVALRGLQPALRARLD